MIRCRILSLILQFDIGLILKRVFITQGFSEEKTGVVGMVELDLFIKEDT